MEDRQKKLRFFRFRKYILPAIIFILILAMLRSAFYTVSESDQAVVQTFGRYTATVDPGLHAKLPWPIQTVTMLPVQRTQKLELGYYQDDDGEYHSEAEDSLMITGDMNLVNIDFFLEWKISDPVSYLFKSENPKLVLQNMLMSSVRSIVGIKSIDDTLTTGKYEIARDVREMLSEKLEESDIGIQVVDVKVNDSEPPTEEVARAFRDVETAKQQKDTTLNQANEYKNRVLPEADARADRLIRDAEARKQTRVNEAQGLKDRYTAMYSEYKTAPEIHQSRLFLDMLRERLPELRVIIDDTNEMKTYLPLDNTTKASERAGALLNGEEKMEEEVNQHE